MRCVSKSKPMRSNPRSLQSHAPEGQVLERGFFLNRQTSSAVKISRLVGRWWSKYFVPTPRYLHSLESYSDQFASWSDALLSQNAKRSLRTKTANNTRGSSARSSSQPRRSYEIVTVALNHPCDPYLRAWLITHSKFTVKPQNLEAPFRNGWANSTFIPARPRLTNGEQDKCCAI